VYHRAVSRPGAETRAAARRKRVISVVAMPEPKRILIVRASAIGDVVFASPFAAALKRTWPDAHVTWLIEPGIAPLIADDPCIDELIHWPKGEWKKLWKAHRFGALFAAIRDFSRLLTCRACSRAGC